MSAPAPSRGPSPLRVGGLVLLGVGAVAGLIGLASLATQGGGDGGGTAAPPAATSTLDPGFSPTDSATIPPDATDPSTPGGEGGTGVPGGDPAAPGEGGGTGAPGGDPGTGDTAAPGGEGGVPMPTFPPAEPGGEGGTGGGGAGGGDTGPAPGAEGGGDAAGSGGGGGGGDVAGGGPMAPLRVYNNSNIEGLAARGEADFEAAGWEVTETGGYNGGRLSHSTVYYTEGTSEQAVAENFGRQFDMRVLPRFTGLRDASPGVIVILTRYYPEG